MWGLVCRRIGCRVESEGLEVQSLQIRGRNPTPFASEQGPGADPAVLSTGHAYHRADQKVCT